MDGWTDSNERTLYVLSKSLKKKKKQLIIKYYNPFLLYELPSGTQALSIENGISMNEYLDAHSTHHESLTETCVLRVSVGAANCAQLDHSFAKHNLS